MESESTRRSTKYSLQAERDALVEGNLQLCRNKWAGSADLAGGMSSGPGVVFGLWDPRNFSNL